ncbi:MAG: alpha/beta hydrolase [Clostridia bacterium]|nr:alpha/beta hydrolase [Clostridia bacterium]
MQTQIQGLSTHYIDLPGTRGTVLFLHGWGAHIGLYQPIFDLLQQLDYRVVAFDMPGVGKTEEPKQPLTIDDYVAFTLELCGKLELEEVILMCHSHGGRIALSMLTDANCPVKCRKAVFYDAAGVRKAAASSQKLRQMGYKAIKWLGTSKLTAPLFDDLYEELRDKRASADYKAATPVMRQTMNNVLPLDFTAKMPSITAEVLLLWGEHDTATPLEHGQIMEQRIPNAGLAVIRNAGHFSHADNWPQFSAVLRAFL